MIEQLLVLALLVSCTAAVGGLRRGSGRVMYGWIQSLMLFLGVLALRDDREALSLVVIGLTAATVVLPALLDRVARWAFARAWVEFAVGLHSWRAALMPGAGLGLQQAVLRALTINEQRGVDAALEYLNRLEEADENGTLRAVVQEQTLALLFQAGRFEQGLRTYDEHFHPGYAALRPPLALGLIRACGECGHLSRAATILMMMEKTLAKADPRAHGLLGQARLTLLSYAGAAGVVDEAIQGGDVMQLGVSEAAGEFFRAVAHARAGHLDVASEALNTVLRAAQPTDHQVRRAASRALRDIESLRLGAEMEDSGLAPETLRVVARALQESLERGVRVRVKAWPVVPLALGGLMLAHYVVVTVFLESSTPSGVNAAGGVVWTSVTDLASWTAWIGAGTASWCHLDPLMLCLNLYAIWMTAKIAEARLGPARYWSVLVSGAVAANLVVMALHHHEVLTMWGGATMALVSVGAALPEGLRVARAVPGANSRRWYLVLGMFISALALSHLVQVGPISAAVSGAVAMAWGVLGGLTLAPRDVVASTQAERKHPESARARMDRMHRVERVDRPGWAFAAVLALATVGCFGSRIFAASIGGDTLTRGVACERGGVTLQEGVGTFVSLPPDPVVDLVPPLRGGMYDTFALKTRRWVQFTVLDAVDVDDLERPGRGEVPPVLAELFDDPTFGERFSVTRATPPAWLLSQSTERRPARAWDLRRGGEVVGTIWLRMAYPNGPVLALAGDLDVASRRYEPLMLRVVAHADPPARCP